MPYLDMIYFEMIFSDAFNQTLYNNDDSHDDAIDYNLDLHCVDGGGKEKGLYNDVVSLVESYPLYLLSATNHDDEFLSKLSLKNLISRS